MLGQPTFEWLMRNYCIVDISYFVYPSTLGLLNKANRLRRSWSQRLEAVKLAGNAAIADCFHC
jgi:hypothetical protein